MLVLVTNDDGIGAEGIHELRRALQQLDGFDVRVIAPHINRSGVARSITTRSPLWVEEVEFADGHRGFATDGTPVDCVRFADLGLLGRRPDLIVSGINHGANLGDDVTYSGTVAAAFEGLLLGLPAIAVSQQARPGNLGYQSEPELDFTVAARFAAGLVEAVAETGLPEGMLLNVNCPAGEVKGVEVTRLGKRLYNDELREVGRGENGRRSFQIYGFEPSWKDEEGTDLWAVARGKISITPVHLDLTHGPGLERLREWDVEALYEMATAPTPEGA